MVPVLRWAKRFTGSRVAIAVVALLVGAAAASLIWILTSDRRGAQAGSGSVSVSYEREPTKLIAGSSLFDRVAATINTEVALPDDIEVQVVGGRSAAQAGVSSPTYDPNDRVVYFPWSFIRRSHRDLATLADDTAGLQHEDADRVLRQAMAFVLYHELSHGIVDELGVPILAGEERTADSLATVLSILTDIKGEALPLSAAVLELAASENGGKPSLADFADDHGFGRQRAFDAICAVYGSAPDQHPELVTGKTALPETRARLCQYDYEKLVRDWRRTLGPNLTDEGRLLPPDFESPPPIPPKKRDDLERQLEAQGGG